MLFRSILVPSPGGGALQTTFRIRYGGIELRSSTAQTGARNFLGWREQWGVGATEDQGIQRRTTKDKGCYSGAVGDDGKGTEGRYHIVVLFTERRVAGLLFLYREPTA